MSNRCPSCNKFASLIMAEPEIEQDIEVDQADGSISGSVRVFLTSACCGEEISDTVFEISDYPDGLPDHTAEHIDHDEEYELTLEHDDPEATERYQDKDREGEPIPFRYQKHFYGFQLDGKVTCSCGLEYPFSVTDEEQASGMNELN